MFSEATKRIQAQRGSRAAYARVEEHGGFNTLIDDDLRAFLAQIDTAFLATADATGQPYVQHRGGPKGFIRALDDHRLAFVDLRGNRQYISTGNLSENNRVCLFLIDYAHRQRVKVWGTAEITDVPPELAHPKAEQLIVITVTRWDVNCPQHIPVKIDAQDAATAIARLEARIADLEEQLRVARLDR